jgi:hypothetical protein
MRYCIGCSHLRFVKPRRASGSDVTGSWTVEDARLACAKGHWYRAMTDYAAVGGAELEALMELAQTCADYKERPTP